MMFDINIVFMMPFLFQSSGLIGDCVGGFLVKMMKGLMEECNRKQGMEVRRLVYGHFS